MEDRAMEAKYSAIDISVVNELFDFDVENHDDIFPMLFDIFRKTAPQYLDQIEIACEQDDWKMIMHHAHTLKASAGNVGAKTVSDLCKAIENNAKIKDSVTV